MNRAPTGIRVALTAFLTRNLKKPSAFLLSSTGLLQVIADPRTTVAQSLEALLIAELADHDGWSNLISLAEGFGQDEMANDFRRALHEEEHHLAQVRAWLSADVKAEAGVA